MNQTEIDKYNLIVPACRKLSGKLASPPLCSCKPGECKHDKKKKK